MDNDVQKAIEAWEQLAKKHQDHGALDSEPIRKFQRFKKRIVDSLLEGKEVLVPSDWDLYDGADAANKDLSMAAWDLVKAVKNTRLSDFKQIKPLLME